MKAPFLGKPSFKLVTHCDINFSSQTIHYAQKQLHVQITIKLQKQRNKPELNELLLNHLLLVFCKQLRPSEISKSK